jgi:hypothetical protein
MGKEERIFVRDGRRHYRRTYSRAEPLWGLAVVVVLLAVLAWVLWKGAHPEPGLFEAPVIAGEQGGAAARGPLPEGLAPPGWLEGKVSHFDAGNLYVKIDGRADYYLSLGFERLHFVSLASETDPERVVDIELFDQGSAANALGAYEGERSPGTETEMGASGLYHLDRNALFMTRGRFYARAIGAEESEAVRSLLLHLRERLVEGLPAEPLPWAYALFVGEMGLKPGGVSYSAENAFSFGFARDVYAALLEDGETEIFVVALGDEAQASELAERFTSGFRQYGKPTGSGKEPVRWSADRYIGTISGALALDSWVLGVRGAASLEGAQAAMTRLRRAVSALPEEVIARARPSAEAPSPRSGEGEGENPGEGDYMIQTDQYNDPNEGM